MNRKKLTIIIVTILVLILLFPIGITFSRYVIRTVKNYILEANNFFFNSDKLVEGGTSYGINNWGGVGNIDIQFQLNNHKNNILTSDTDIAYTLTTSCDSSVVCNLSSNSGTIYKAEKTDNLTLTIVPQRAFDDNESFQATVIASSTSPYVKTLSATFTVTVGKRGITYEITDKATSPYFMFSITNALDTYKVITAFGNYSVGDPLTSNEYLALTPQQKQNCASVVVTLTFDPSIIVLDTTSDILKKSTTTTSSYQGVQYINSITFGVEALDSEEIRFYKRDSSNNYTYPIVNNSSIVTFTAS